MEGLKIENQEDFFGKYEILESDIETIIDDINEVYELDLFDKELINKIRFVSFDSKYFYVITKGEHKNIDGLILEEREKDSFKIYKFKNDQPEKYGKTKQSYRGAQAWFLDEQIEKTANDEDKDINSSLFFQPNIKQAERILYSVKLPPQKAFEKIHGQKWDYFSNLVVHEIAHIDDINSRLKNKEKDFLSIFGSEESEKEFWDLIFQSTILPKNILEDLKENFNYMVIAELYAMIFDSIALKRKDFEKWNKRIEKEKENLEFYKNNFSKINKEQHQAAGVILRILENEIPDDEERIWFIKKIILE